MATALLVAGCAGRPSVLDRAALLADKGDHRGAIAELSGHLERHPKAVPERRLLIRVLALSGRFGQAQQQADVLARQLGPDSPTPYIELGHAYELSHRYDAALEAYDRAAEVAPADAVGPRTGGLRAARWGEAELAEPRLSEALRRNPADSEGWHALGVVRMRLGDSAGARRAYLAGLVADPQDLTHRVGLATLALHDGRPADALAEYDRILAARPELADAHLGRSWALIQLGRLQAARAALADARAAGADPQAVRRQLALLDALEAGPPGGDVAPR